MARGGKRPGAGRKPNPHKGKSANPAREPQAPRSYDPEVAYQARKLCQIGATDIEIADFFGVNADTIYRWKIEFSEFSEAIKLGKEPADDRVERSLYQRAVGYTFESVKIFMPAKANEPVYAPYREHVPPDTAAASLWLRNRRSGFLYRGAAMGADCSDSVVFGSAGCVVRGFGDGIAVAPAVGCIPASFGASRLKGRLAMSPGAC